MKFEIGEKVYVKPNGGDWTLSEIVHWKKIDQEVEYLIHYEGSNRRLDEWVSSDRIRSLDCDSLPENSNIIQKEQQLQRTVTRRQKRRFDEMHHVEKSFSEMDARTAALEKEYAEKTKIKFINKVILGKFEIDTWYYSPYPNQYEKINTIYVCEKCLKYMGTQRAYLDHIKTCEHKRPYGKQIYCKDSLYIFEIDGEEQKLYCQNLCLLAKLFLDHKTLYFDVAPFLFYVCFEHENDEFHITSYFSKEKESIDDFNLACILTFPPYQRKGYGKFLISLSYELSKRQNKIGSPEKPLSDLGKISYRSYWAYYVLDFLQNRPPSTIMSLSELSMELNISKIDLMDTFQMLNMVTYSKGNYVISFNRKIIEKYIDSQQFKPPKLLIDPNFLTL